jgi:hypothetical protein
MIQFATQFALGVKTSGKTAKKKKQFIIITWRDAHVKNVDYSTLVSHDVLWFRIVKACFGGKRSPRIHHLFMLKLTWITALVHPNHLHITSFVSIHCSLDITRTSKILLWLSVFIIIFIFYSFKSWRYFSQLLLYI